MAILEGPSRNVLHILFFAATNALNDVEALVPVLARLVLHLPAWAFGALSTAFGLGALAGWACASITKVTIV
ncbi:MAG: hypothetical protein M0Z66_10695 [Thermaerobacter sp.]|nr:hypothetical protein [Thermaerobacter sp.]